MMVNQHTSGLDVHVAKEGCLFLCYLAVGWLYSAVQCAARGERVPVWTTPGGYVNSLYQHLSGVGAIRRDCFVLKPREVVASMLDGDALHDAAIAVTKHPGGYRGVHTAPMATADVPGFEAPLLRDPRAGFVADVAHWRLDDHHHFTMACANPWFYYDPWVGSVCAARGSLVSVRRVVVSQ